MSKVITEKEQIVAVADAIRNKTGNTNLMTLSEMVNSVKTISGGGWWKPARLECLRGRRRIYFKQTVWDRVLNSIRRHYYF